MISYKKNTAVLFYKTISDFGAYFHCECTQTGI